MPRELRIIRKEGNLTVYTPTRSEITPEVEKMAEKIMEGMPKWAGYVLIREI